MDLNARRGLLAAESNPGRSHDYVSTLERMVDGFLKPGHRTMVSLRYVPDKLVLDPQAFTTYLEVIAGLDWKSLEDVAVTVLDDLENEVVPRWLQVSIEAETDETGDTEAHSVVLEARQPQWRNEALLKRLKPY